MIDCKTLNNKNGLFPVSRVEFNQQSAYKVLSKVKSYNYNYYILWNNNVYSIPIKDVLNSKTSIDVKKYEILWENFYEN